MDSWKLGAKAISIYRDGSKRTQPLNTSREQGRDRDRAAGGGRRWRRSRSPCAGCPDERRAITHKFDIGGPRGLRHRGSVRGRQPGELFLVMAKEGSTISGFADAFAQAISYALQYGVPLQVSWTSSATPASSRRG